MRQHCPKRQTYNKQHPPVTQPRIAQARHLRKNIGHIGCTIRDVRKHGEGEQNQQSIELQNAPRKRQAHYKMDDHNDCEQQVVQNAPWLPVANRVAEVITPLEGFHEVSLCCLRLSIESARCRLPAFPSYESPRPCAEYCGQSRNVPEHPTK